MIKVALLVFGSIFLVVALMALVGATLDAEHSVTRSAIIQRPAAEIWAVIRDFERAPDWQPDVEAIERRPPVDGREAWRMEGGLGAIPFEVAAEDPPRRLVTTITDPSLPFGGRWTYTLESVDGGAATRVTITEDGHVRNPFFRFMSRIVFGYERTAERYLDALTARLLSR